ncbi:protein rolling stone-like [Saccoglossus kowalevskii]|uniref:Protein rolling stone-like n=1 Tax=Saccoglossus kowalevskii TaxID=10224 RepID=A0ABM0MW04_SACKO|nr:PREDICTED: protein rolling stone-like [Saccoglossus kowalevskii]
MCETSHSAFGVQKSEFGFSYDDPSAFVRSQFRNLSPWILVGYRVSISIYVNVCFTVYMATSSTEIGWNVLIYYPNWSFLFLALYLSVSTLSIIHYHITNRYRHRGRWRENDYSEWQPLTCDVTQLLSTPCHYRLSWFLYNISMVSSLGVTTTYLLTNENLIGRVSKFACLQIYFINTIVALIEVIFSAMPTRIAHVIYILLILLLYTIVTVVCFAVGGAEGTQSLLYSFLDYGENPELSVLILLLMFLGAITFHILLWVIFKLKIYISLEGKGDYDSMSPRFSSAESSGNYGSREPKTEVAMGPSSLP